MHMVSSPPSEPHSSPHSHLCSVVRERRGTLSLAVPYLGGLVGRGGEQHLQEVVQQQVGSGHDRGRED